MKRLGIVCGGAITFFAALAFAACGGTSGVDDLFTPAGSGGGSGGASSSGPAATTGSSAVTASSSSGAATTSSGVASSSAASSTASSTSSSTGGPPAPVACNDGVCQPGQICCFNPNGPGDHCSTKGTCAPGWAELDCSSPAGCPGGVCCATVDVNMQVPYLGMTCEPGCNPGNQVVVCSVQQPGVCPMGTLCQTSQSLGAGFDICWPGG